MLNEIVQTALNNQIRMELSAFYTYMSMTAYLEAEGLRGLATWMRHHADEEMMHAMKIYDFIHERRGRVLLQALPEPRTQWQSPIDVFEDALKHEQKVTASINQLMELAIEQRDFATQSFLKWFVDEQVEEEAVVDEVLQQLRLIGDFKPGLYLLDRDLLPPNPSAENEDTPAK